MAHDSRSTVQAHESTSRPYRRLLPVVVCGGAIMGLALGIRHVQGLFLLPITSDRQWSREAFAFAIALQNLVWGFAQPFTGLIADRFGTARVLVAGVALYAAGLLLMTVATTPVEFTLAAGVLIGVALSCTAFATVYGAVSRIVEPRHRPWALGVTGAVGGLGQFVMVPTAQGLLTWLQWGATLAVLAVAIAATAPAALKLRDRAVATGTMRAQSIGERTLSLDDQLRLDFAFRDVNRHGELFSRREGG